MKCKYRVRWFSSKRAFLVLLWTLLVAIHCSILVHIVIVEYHQTYDLSVTSKWSLSVPAILTLVSAPLSGWLADAKFGNYKVFRVGAVLLFISAVMLCLFLIIKELNIESSHVLNWILLLFVSCFFAVGSCACFVTALSLGLDQMPDASSSRITSYIAWFVCSLLFGNFFNEVLEMLEKKSSNLNINDSYLRLFFALFSTICMSMVVVLNFFFSPKWLIIEPKSPQSLKIVYQVLKFAAKHKAPLNRSALTYWEEDVPSRIDLGKSKYGGPFTTEQVEDVKTLLRLLVISLPIFFICLILSFRIHKYNVKKSSAGNDSNVNSASLTVITSFLLNETPTYATIATFVFEFLVYPLMWNRLPSILKRIGAVPLTMSVVSLVCFALMLAHHLSYSSETTTELIAYVLYFSFNGILFQVLLTAVLEFMSAQSPYHMRGLLLSFIVPFTLVSYTTGWRIGSIVSQKVCSVSWCSPILFSLKVVTCFIGFLLFCIVSHWYKMRVRDEDYSPQRVVEEVYDRYLTAAAAQSRSVSYGTTNHLHSVQTT